MKINLLAPINQLSYGISSINIGYNLDQLGYNVAFHNMPMNQIDGTVNPEFITKSTEQSLDYDVNAPCLKIWHTDDMKTMIGNGKKIGFSFFELDRIPKQDIANINKLDGFCATSEWAKEVLVNSGVKIPIAVCPLGVDRSIFNENLKPHPENDIANDNATKFYTGGKFEVRKSHDIVIKAFEKAFKPSDDVALIANCHNMFIGKEGNDRWASYYKSSKLGDKVFILPNYLPTQQNVAALMASVDCGVFCSRAEGWNLELLECMSMGKEVIATYATAHTEYCTPQNALLVDVGPMEVAQDGVFFHKQGEWPSMGDTQIDQIVEHMRFIHKVKQQGAKLFNSDGVDTAKLLSWKNTALKISQGIA